MYFWTDEKEIYFVQKCLVLKKNHGFKIVRDSISVRFDADRTENPAPSGLAVLHRLTLQTMPCKIVLPKFAIRKRRKDWARRGRNSKVEKGVVYYLEIVYEKTYGKESLKIEKYLNIRVQCEIVCKAGEPFLRKVYY